MIYNKNKTISCLYIVLVSLVFIMNSCRKSSPSIEYVTPSILSKSIGIYDVTDTFITYSGYPNYVRESTYHAQIVTVTAKDLEMIQFDALLNDHYSYPLNTRTLDNTGANYRYFTYDPSYTASGCSYEILVKFKDDSMLYTTYNSLNFEIHRGKGIRRKP